MRGFDEEAVENFAEAVRKPFENNFIGYGDETFPARLVRMLKEKGSLRASLKAAQGACWVLRLPLFPEALLFSRAQ
ncbi:MAG: hypothetical protein LRY50_07295 [Geovibrio sp.]|nr:hypothetical protein [Geovibrio sp.]